MDLSSLVKPAAVREKARADLTIDHRLRAFPAVRMGDAGDKGRGLFAARRIRRGEVIAVEPAFCWEREMEGDDSAVEATHDTDATGQLLCQMAPFGDARDGSATEIAVPLREVAKRALDANSFSVGEAAQAPEERDVTERRDGRALFLIICLANHSCAPSAKAYQQEPKSFSVGSPPVYVLEARRDIEEGEEVTIAYLPRAWHKDRRAESMRAQWGFACGCERCSAPWDDTIVFRCRTCGDGRIYWTLNEDALRCQDCGATADHFPEPDGLSRDALLARARDDHAMVGEVFDAPLPVTVIADKLLSHPLLAHEDVRVFSALSTLLGYLDPQPDPVTGQPTEEGCLYERVAQAIALAAVRAPYVTPADLGIEVVDER